MTTRRGNLESRVLDQAARARRLKKSLDLLEQDNFGSDPHDSGEASVATRNTRSSYAMDSNVPSDSKLTKKRLSAVQIRRLMKRNLMAILEEQVSNKEQKAQASYNSASAPPSKLPTRNFCAVCGFVAPYTCCQCGTRFCSIRCKETHKETRCLKWLV